MAMPWTQAQQRTPLDRPARLRGLALLILLLSMLLVLGGMIWRNWNRLDHIHAYLSYAHRIQYAGLDLQQAFMDRLTVGQAPNRERLREISRKIENLRSEKDHLLADTPNRLQQVVTTLANVSSEPAGGPALFEALELMHEILDRETEQREAVLEEINRDTLTELELATGTLIALLALAWAFFKRRILTPLHDLRLLFLRLTQEDYVPIDIRGLDPLLLPIFNSYNVMVKHLAELEEAKRKYAQSLETEVRAATQALLEQQRSLARAERLAAVGELAASLAHELRNPLAGVQMSCANLRSEVHDPEQAERLDLIGAELKRMVRLLNALLEQSRETPEPPSEFDLAVLVRELFALTRYQIPPQIALNYDIPPDLHCHLPESHLRQALLNVVLNAAQALDQRTGSIMLRAWRADGNLHIEVSDDGPGFGPNVLSEGIRPFSTTRVCGTGLGLAIVQRFVREAGGQIHLGNRDPHGAIVSLILPVRAPT